MKYMSQDDEEFWENPPRLDKLGFPGTVLKTDDRKINEDSPYRSRSSFFVLGDPDDDTAPTATVLRIPPGYGLPYHAHSCDIFMLVLKGTLFVPGRVLKPGDGQFARAHEFYGPEVAGPEGCTRVEFFADLKGATSVEYELPDGERLTWDSLTEGQAPWRMGMEGYPELLSRVFESLGAPPAQLAPATPRDGEAPRPGQCSPRVARRACSRVARARRVIPASGT